MITPRRMRVSVSPSRVLSEIGPPFSVALTPDESLALVTSSWDGSALKEIGRPRVSGASAAVRTAEK